MQPPDRVPVGTGLSSIYDTTFGAALSSLAMGVPEADVRGVVDSFHRQLVANPNAVVNPVWNALRRRAVDDAVEAYNRRTSAVWDAVVRESALLASS